MSRYKTYVSVFLLSFVFSTIPLVQAASCPQTPRRSFLAGALSKILAAGGVCTSQTTVTEQGSYWIHPDYQGSMNAETDSAGNTVLSVAYRPYGSQLSIAGSSTESLGYTGQREDPSTGLLYLHARYYDPTLGRFISPDPVIPGKEIVHLNRYAYADNNPINKTDVTGMGAEGDVITQAKKDVQNRPDLAAAKLRELDPKGYGVSETPLYRIGIDNQYAPHMPKCNLFCGDSLVLAGFQAPIVRLANGEEHYAAIKDWPKYKNLFDYVTNLDDRQPGNVLVEETNGHGSIFSKKNRVIGAGGLTVYTENIDDIFAEKIIKNNDGSFTRPSARGYEYGKRFWILRPKQAISDIKQKEEKDNQSYLQNHQKDL